MGLEPGQIVDGKYRIVRTIGVGGMGVVYEGENVLIRRRVAIKVMVPSPNASPADAIRRFESEAQAAGQIGSDHILEVLDIGALETGDRYMVMEYLDGETLAARISRRGQLEPGAIAPIARQFLAALAAAHAAGIVHRDLKPENIFILRSKAGRSDFVKLIDFGVSKFSHPAETPRTTRAGALLGTPCYMSPEQARGRGEADVRSDIYACGVILFEAVTGQLPFEGESFNDLLFKIALSEMPSPLSRLPTLDPEFSALIEHAMAREPDDRFQTVHDFVETLDVWMLKNGLGSMLTATPVEAFPPRSVKPLPDDTAPLPTMQTPRLELALQTIDATTRESWAPSYDPPPRSRRSLVLLFVAIASVTFAAVIAMKTVRSHRRPELATTASTAMLVMTPAELPPSPDPLPAASTPEIPSAVASTMPAPTTTTTPSRPHGKPRAAAKPASATTAPSASKPLDFGY